MSSSSSWEAEFSPEEIFRIRTRHKVEKIWVSTVVGTSILAIAVICGILYFDIALQDVSNQCSRNQEFFASVLLSFQKNALTRMSHGSRVETVTVDRHSVSNNSNDVTVSWRLISPKELIAFAKLECRVVIEFPAHASCSTINITSEEFSCHRVENSSSLESNYSYQKEQTLYVKPQHQYNDTYVRAEVMLTLSHDLLSRAQPLIDIQSKLLKSNFEVDHESILAQFNWNVSDYSSDGGGGGGGGQSYMYSSDESAAMVNLGKVECKSCKSLLLHTCIVL